VLEFILLLYILTVFIKILVNKKRIDFNVTEQLYLLDRYHELNLSNLSQREVVVNLAVP
jgi:hypothetical protein